MEVVIPAALKSLASAGAALKELANWRKRAKGDARAIVSEIRDNLIYLDMVTRDGVDPGEIVAKLSVSEFRRLERDGYNFNSLKRGRIAKHESLRGTDLASWAGKETADLVVSIYEKINDLKIRYPHVSKKSRYRWNVRVNNIRKRIWLLLRHVRS